MSNTDTTLQTHLSGDCPGKPVLERIEARRTELSKNFPVRRALPTRARRLVGAWCFLDHAGPAQYEAGQGMNVGPHPHTGLQTFTWMIEGEITHHDSLGYRQVIRPGQVNLMTAGRGIAHAEISVGDGPGRVQAVQLWIALPDAERYREPAFEHYPELPVLNRDGFHLTVLTGETLGQRSPVAVFSPLVALDLVAPVTAATTLPLNPAFEHATLCLEGTCNVAGEPIERGTLLYLGLGRHELTLETGGPARLLLIGGEPFKEDVLLWWNFVARTSTEIHQAAEDWMAHRRFGEVPDVTLPRLAMPDINGINLTFPKKRSPT